MDYCKEQRSRCSLLLRTNKEEWHMFTPTYHQRNLNNLEKLAPNTKKAAMEWYNWCVTNGIDILIYETIRTEEQQRENVRKGVSQTMQSYHLVGQALDFVPIVNGKADWNGYNRPEIQRAIAKAKQLGFEWGGDWKTLVDKPHLQYNYKGYGTDKQLDGWQQKNGKWYFYKNGVRQTGWVQDKGKWYYLDSNGAMKTGWIQDKNKWYYLDPATGAMKTGWVNVDNKWYYLDKDGAMKTGWIQDKGKWYYLGEDGAMKTGLIKDKGKWYYLKENGEMASDEYVPVKVGKDGALILP
jgi:peptidoglycan LD-endopeptidase CwlK